MADASVDLQASNPFALHANFKNQTATSLAASVTNFQVMDEYGNVSCESNIQDIETSTCSAQYCGSDFVADLGTFLTTFGDVQNGICVTGLTISMTASDYCTIDVEGHNHSANAHASAIVTGRADVSDFLPHEVTEAFVTWDGFGVPDFGVTVGSDASPSSATVTFSMTHVDQIAEDGTHLVGKNITPRCELSMEFSGIPTVSTGVVSTTLAAIKADLETNTNTMLDPLVDSVDWSDSNSEFDSFAFTAHAHADLETA